MKTLTVYPQGNGVSIGFWTAFCRDDCSHASAAEAARCYAEHESPGQVPETTVVDDWAGWPPAQQSREAALMLRLRLRLLYDDIEAGRVLHVSERLRSAAYSAATGKSCDLKTVVRTMRRLPRSHG